MYLYKIIYIYIIWYIYIHMIIFLDVDGTSFEDLLDRPSLKSDAADGSRNSRDSGDVRGDEGPVLGGIND
jgi:hypothetical protein